MAIPVLVEGKSGSGKTYSLKKFKQDEVGIFSVEKGRLPFKSDLKVVRVPENFTSDVKTYADLNRRRYAWLYQMIERAKVKSLVIDDSQFLMANEMFERAMEKGYDKFTDMAKNFHDLVHEINKMPQDDKIVYFLHHVEADTEGILKAKTVGKMLDSMMVLESCFDIVIYCENHQFYTQANAVSTAKTPEGMFETLDIPNDLKAVDDSIREYYNIPREGNKEDK